MIGKEVRNLRAKYEMTQQQLAETAKVELSEVIRLEKHGTFESLDRLRKVADALGREVEIRLVQPNRSMACGD